MPDFSKMKKKGPNKVRLSVSVSPAAASAAKTIADRYHTTVSEVIEFLIIESLKD